MTSDQPIPDNRASMWKEFPDSQCDLWTGPVNRTGYGVARMGKTTTSAHRSMWILLRGPIPDELEVDHLCRNRLCVNIDHLELVTPSENVRRSPRAQVTECPRGHPLDGDNLHIQIGPSGRPWRTCNICRQAARRRYEERRR